MRVREVGGAVSSWRVAISDYRPAGSEPDCRFTQEAVDKINAKGEPKDGRGTRVGGCPWYRDSLPGEGSELRRCCCCPPVGPAGRLA